MRVAHSFLKTTTVRRLLERDTKSEETASPEKIMTRWLKMVQSHDFFELIERGLKLKLNKLY